MAGGTEQGYLRLCGISRVGLVPGARAGKVMLPPSCQGTRQVRSHTRVRGVICLCIGLREEKRILQGLLFLPKGQQRCPDAICRSRKGNLTSTSCPPLSRQAIIKTFINRSSIATYFQYSQHQCCLILTFVYTVCCDFMYRLNGRAIACLNNSERTGRLPMRYEYPQR